MRIVIFAYIFFIPFSGFSQDTPDTRFFNYQLEDLMLYEKINNTGEVTDIIKYRIVSDSINTDSVRVFTAYKEYYSNPNSVDTVLFKIFSDGSISTNYFLDEELLILDTKISSIDDYWVGGFLEKDSLYNINFLEVKDSLNFFQFDNIQINVFGFNVSPDTSSNYQQLGLEPFHYDIVESFGIVGSASSEFGVGTSIKGGTLQGEVFGDTTFSIPTSNFYDQKIPSEFNYIGNYPNPFNPSTTIKYTMTKPGTVQLKLYDITGRLVKEIINESKIAGEHTVELDASDLSSGTYILIGKLGDVLKSQRITLIK